MEAIQQVQRNKKKDMLLRVYNNICIPALIIHELLHYIFIKITFANFTRASVFLSDDYEYTSSFAVAIFYVPTNKFQKVLVSIAPIFAILISPILFYFDFNNVGIGCMIYQSVCFRIVLPSKEDLDFALGKEQGIVK